MNINLELCGLPCNSPLYRSLSRYLKHLHHPVTSQNSSSLLIRSLLNILSFCDIQNVVYLLYVSASFNFECELIQQDCIEAMLLLYGTQ